MVRAPRPRPPRWPILGAIFRNRALVVIAGYVVASLTASITIQAGSLSFWLAEGKLLSAFLQSGSYAFTAAVGIVVAHLAMLPALAFMVYGEFARVRSVAFYVGAGALAGLGIFLFLAVIGAMKLLSGSMLVNLVVIFLLPGLSAGLAYWAIAGRTAGVRMDDW